MIGRGKHNGAYLYEVTEQDLLLDDESESVYHAGTVLMFTDRRRVGLGNEFARGEDLAAAKEYLDQGDRHNDRQDSTHESEMAALASQVVSRDKSLRDLTEKIEQRDELLRDLSESLKSQRQDNELLHALLEQARTQLAVDELRHNELVGDLRYVSEETHTIENTLERVLGEKFKLEQELAERITDLVELDLQNDDLKKRISESQSSINSSASTEANTSIVADVADKPSIPSNRENLSAESDTRILTMASGKKIHVLHEFPTAPQQTAPARIGHAFASSLRVVLIILCAILLLGFASVITTAQ
ncbi:MAG: hypothetical protein LBK67_05375, partial [Coriobacteriales bacterium]|nr:hypothetical protein [Coriobacteriales bacterium]